MKKVILLVLLCLLGGAAYYYYGNPPAWVKKKVDTYLPAVNTTTVYKWRDKQGNWQITDTPPASGIPFEKLEYRNDANLMPAEELTGKKKD